MYACVTRDSQRPGLQCLFPDLPAIIGYAVTSRIRCSNPPPVGHSYPDRTDWWAFMQSVSGPRIAVIQDIDREPGLGASVGEVHARILQSLGCVGAVTNGAVRDLPSVRALEFPMFAANVSVSHAYVHMIDFGTPVEIFGLQIRTGRPALWRLPRRDLDSARDCLAASGCIRKDRLSKSGA